MHHESPPSAAGQPAAVPERDPTAEREWLSALLDGECPHERVAALTADRDRGEALRQDWARYHCLGEVLRSGASAAPSADLAFADAVLARLAHEPLSANATAPPPRLPQSPQLSAEPANDPVFRWKMVAALASLAAVVALSLPLLATAPEGAGTQWAGAPGAPSAGLQVAERSAQSAALHEGAQTPQGVLLRDPQLDAMLAAHRQHGAISALHVSVGFLRNVTYEIPAH